jgi:hypothetical protein
MVRSIYTYSVSPFSQTDHQAQQRAWDRASRLAWSELQRFMGCGLCGRPVDKVKAPGWGHVVDGGASWGGNVATGDRGDMGIFPIGPECHRQFKVALAI